MSMPSSRHEVEVLVAQKMAEDPTLRERLIDDPRGTLEGLLGTTIPESVTFEVHQDTLSHVHLVLPAVGVDGELNEEDLELAAGGLGGPIPSAAWFCLVE